MNQLTCQAVIFDLDGVLVDSTIVVEGTWRRWAEAHGLDFERVMQVAHGRPARDTVRLVAPHLDSEAEAARLAVEEAHEIDGLVRIEGAVQLVDSLPKGRWAVATSGTREIAATRLTFAGVAIPAVLVTADDVERGKPDPQAYALAAKRLGVPPESCVVTEDAPAGIQGARAAGMGVIAVATTHPREALQDADVIVGRLADICASTDDVGRITIFVGGDHAAAD
ncbi:MAG: HAD family hydrolase [Anaerolineae bacterium]